jgi:hypothetical protein
MLVIMIDIFVGLLLITLFLIVIIILASLFRRSLRSLFNRIGWILIVCAGVFAAALYYLTTILYLSTHGLNLLGQKVSLSDLISTFLTSLLYSTAVFHFLAYSFGPRLTRIFTHWVKAIDYVYLTLSIASLLRIVMSMSAMEADNNFTAYSTVALSIAVALRLTKTTIEICSWDKPRTVS